MEGTISPVGCTTFTPPIELSECGTFLRGFGFGIYSQRGRDRSRGRGLVPINHVSDGTAPLQLNAFAFPLAGFGYLFIFFFLYEVGREVGNIRHGYSTF
jgi:hypothetical protein